MESEAYSGELRASGVIDTLARSFSESQFEAGEPEEPGEPGETTEEPRLPECRLVSCNRLKSDRKLAGKQLCVQIAFPCRRTRVRMIQNTPNRGSILGAGDVVSVNKASSMFYVDKGENTTMHLSHLDHICMCMYAHRLHEAHL